jgi:hypothetical protein
MNGSAHQASGGLAATNEQASSAAEQLKEQGNAEHRNGNYLKAAALYTQGIKLQADNAVLYR